MDAGATLKDKAECLVCVYLFERGSTGRWLHITDCLQIYLSPGLHILNLHDIIYPLVLSPISVCP